MGVGPGAVGRPGRCPAGVAFADCVAVRWTPPATGGATTTAIGTTRWRQQSSSQSPCSRNPLTFHRILMLVSKCRSSSSVTWWLPTNARACCPANRRVSQPAPTAGGVPDRPSGRAGVQAERD